MTVEPLGYYVLMECERCDAEIYYGVCVSLLEHNGLPVVMAGHASQTRFDCPKCGTANYVGDLDVHVEGGTEPDVDYDEDEDGALEDADVDEEDV